MKRSSGPDYFLHLFTTGPSDRTCKWSLHEFKLICSVLRRVDVGKIYSLIAQNLKFDWSIQITWKPKASDKHKYSLAQQHQS